MIIVVQDDMIYYMLFKHICQFARITFLKINLCNIMTISTKYLMKIHYIHGGPSPFIFQFRNLKGEILGDVVMNYLGEVSPSWINPYIWYEDPKHLCLDIIKNNKDIYNNFLFNGIPLKDLGVNSKKLKRCERMGF